MSVCLFLTSTGPETNAPDTESTLQWLADFESMQGLQELRAHLPATAVDPMLNDGNGPPLVLQLFFDNVMNLEVNLQPDARLMSCLQTSPMATLLEDGMEHQAMLTRRYGCSAPSQSAADHHSRCTYLVRYTGPAEDPAAWLASYLDGHPPLMTQLPGIRALEIFTRIDWCSALPFPRTDDLQRNQVVFDSTAALTNALNTPLRAEMRAHYDALPPFAGEVTHFPRHTVARRITPHASTTSA